MAVGLSKGAMAIYLEEIDTGPDAMAIFGLWAISVNACAHEPRGHAEDMGAGLVADVRTVLEAGALLGILATPVQVVEAPHVGGAVPGSMIRVILGVQVGHDSLEGGVTLASDVGGCPGARQQVVAPLAVDLCAPSAGGAAIQGEVRL
jgi:hypothetical protein